MNDITISTQQLPDNLNDLSRFVLIGREKLVAVRAAIRAISKVEVAKEVREQKLKEAQEIADAVLDAETKIGELTAAMPKANNQYSAKDTAVPSKKESLSGLGITEKQKQRYEILAKHPEAVESAKAKAREEERIVTREDVFREIREADPSPDDDDRKPTRKQQIRELEEQTAEARRGMEGSGTVDFQELRRLRDDEARLAVLKDKDRWETFTRLNRELEYLAREPRRELITTFRARGMEGVQLPQLPVSDTLNGYLTTFTASTNKIKEILMEVIASEFEKEQERKKQSEEGDRGEGQRDGERAALGPGDGARLEVAGRVDGRGQLPLEDCERVPQRLERPRVFLHRAGRVLRREARHGRG